MKGGWFEGTLALICFRKLVQENLFSFFLNFQSSVILRFRSLQSKSWIKIMVPKIEKRIEKNMEKKLKIFGKILKIIRKKSLRKKNDFHRLLKFANDNWNTQVESFSVFGNLCKTKLVQNQIRRKFLHIRSLISIKGHTEECRVIQNIQKNWKNRLDPVWIHFELWNIHFQQNTIFDGFLKCHHHK